MTYRLKWTPGAREDVREIRAYIERSSNWYGKAVALAIIHAADDILTNPFRHAI